MAWHLPEETGTAQLQRVSLQHRASATKSGAHTVKSQYARARISLSRSTPASTAVAQPRRRSAAARPPAPPCSRKCERYSGARCAEAPCRGGHCQVSVSVGAPPMDGSA